MIPRMRTLKDAFAELKKDDPETAVTEYYIRQLALSGKIPVAMVGRKRLINYDAMLEYLNNPPAEVPKNRDYGKIRKIG